MQEAVITVRNAQDVPDTTARVIVQNKIEYTPKISVIIPVYNTEEYLRECLDSVIGQTLKEIEIICVDDGSTDNSLNILKEYAQKDERITILAQENLHAGVARNAGIAIAKGDYLHFMDSDDWLVHDGYQKILEAIEFKNIDFCKFRTYGFCNERKMVIKDGYCNVSFLEEDKFDTIYNINNDLNIVINLPDSPWSGIYKRSFVVDKNIRFDSLKISNDVSFFFKCVVLAENIFVSSVYVYYYRRNVKGSLIDMRMKNFHLMINLYEIVEKIVLKCDDNIKSAILSKLCHSMKSWYGRFYDMSIDDYRMHRYVFDIMKKFVMLYGHCYLKKSFCCQFDKKPLKIVRGKRLREFYFFDRLIFVWSKSRKGFVSYQKT